MKNDFICIHIPAFNAAYDHLCRALTDYETSGDAAALYSDMVELQRKLDNIDQDE